MTHDECLRQELMMRLEALLAHEPDYHGIPDNRFNKRLEFETPDHKIMVRSKRRGDLVVEIWSRRTQVVWTVLSKCVGSAKTFDPVIAEHYVLPLLRRTMVLDDLAKL